MDGVPSSWLERLDTVESSVERGNAAGRMDTIRSVDLSAIGHVDLGPAPDSMDGEYPMSWRTSPVVLVLRRIGRASGFNRLLGRWRARSGYEERFDRVFRGLLRPGDRVWDVGANVGHYTSAFASLVGKDGLVVAFEPSPTNFTRLSERCAGLTNVRLMQAGLGKTDGNQSFLQGADDLGATSRMGTGPQSVAVLVRAGDNLVKDGEVPVPDVVKVDVEGYEEEVMDGMSGLVRERLPRVVGIEVHFRLLEARGMSSAPRRMESAFRSAGYEVRWPDSSHMIATRKPLCSG